MHPESVGRNSLAESYPVAAGKNYFVSRFARVVSIRLIRVIRVPLQGEAAPNLKFKILQVYGVPEATDDQERAVHSIVLANLVRKMVFR